MDEIGGESNTKGEKNKSKTQKADDRAEDAKLENFAEGNINSRCIEDHLYMYNNASSVYRSVAWG